LNIGRGDGRDSRSEGAQVKVGGAVRVEGVNVDCAPIDGGHGESCTSTCRSGMAIVVEEASGMVVELW